jgi:hypothetical protein
VEYAPHPIIRVTAAIATAKLAILILIAEVIGPQLSNLSSWDCQLPFGLVVCV